MRIFKRAHVSYWFADGSLRLSPCFVGEYYFSHSWRYNRSWFENSLCTVNHYAFGFWLMRIVTKSYVACCFVRSQSTGTVRSCFVSHSMFKWNEYIFHESWSRNNIFFKHRHYAFVIIKHNPWRPIWKKIKEYLTLNLLLGLSLSLSLSLSLGN